MGKNFKILCTIITMVVVLTQNPSDGLSSTREGEVEVGFYGEERLATEDEATEPPSNIAEGQPPGGRLLQTGDLFPIREWLLGGMIFSLGVTILWWKKRGEAK